LAHPITAINPATDTFDTWLTRTNDIANVVTNEVVTANASANGAATTGNAYVFGIFGSDTLTAFTGLRGGNVQVSNTLVISSNVSIIDTFLSVGNSTVNAVVNTQAIVLTNLTQSAILLYSGLTVGNTSVNATSFAIGNSSVNLVSNSTVLTINTAASVASLNALSLSVGNTSFKSIVNGSVVSVINATASANLTPAGITVGTTTLTSLKFAAGANVFGNTTALFVGNASVNAVLTGTSLVLGGNVTLSQTTLAIGNSSVNVVINSSAVSVGGVPSLTTAQRDSVAHANTLIGTRSRINFIEGNNVFLTVTDDAVGGQVNVQINAVATSGAALVGGPNTAIQYNDNGNFNGDATKFSFEKITGTVTVANTLVANVVQIAEGVSFSANSVAFTTSVGPDTIDAIALASYRTADYVYSITNNSANGSQCGKLLVMQDGTNGLLEEFAVAYSNALLGSFSTSANATHVLVQFTPAATLSYTATFSRTSLPL
jgi:hypothetical protein